MISAVERTDVEELIKILGDKSPVGVCIIQEGKFCYLNPTFSMVTGYSADESEGKDALMLVAPEDREVVSENTIKMLKGELSSPYQFRVTCKDGSIKWVMQTVCSIQYRGRPATLGNYMDITERKQAEEALRESEETYRLLSDNASDIIWTADMNLKYTYVSPSVERLLGYTPEELTSLTVDKTLTPPSLELAMRVFQGELAVEQLEQKDSERTRTIESELVCKDGSTVWVEVKMAFLRDEAGHPTGVLGIARDITERKRVEEALKFQKAYFQQLFDSSPDAIVMLDTDDRVVQANRGFETLFGYVAEEITGRPIKKLVIPGDCARDASASSRMVLHGGGHSERSGEKTQGRQPGRCFCGGLSRSF